MLIHLKNTDSGSTTNSLLPLRRELKYLVKRVNDVVLTV